jgi:hypothetical protein
MDNEQITTGVDRLVGLIKKLERISTQDASKQLGVSENLIKEWASILEEQGIISVEFKFTHEYMVMKPTVDVESKAKEFRMIKDTVMVKSETLLAQLQQELVEVNKTREQFQNFKNQIKIESEDLRKYFQLIKIYEQESMEINKRLAKEYSIFVSIANQLEAKIREHQRTFDLALTGFYSAAEAVEKEHRLLDQIEQSKEAYLNKLREVKVQVARQYEQHLGAQDGR